MKVSGQLETPTASLPGEIAAGTHLIGGCVGLRIGFDAVENKEILLCRESNPGRPACSPSLYRLSYADSEIKWFIVSFMLTLILTTINGLCLLEEHFMIYSHEKPKMNAY
jgi:hypothetical protein